MSNSWSLYRTTVAGRKPAAADIAVGQLALNTTDGKIYTKDTNGNIIEVGGVSFTKAESLARYIQQSGVPFSRFGDLSDDALPFSFTGLTVSITAPIPVFIQGTLGSIPVQTITITTSATTKYTLLYVRKINGVISLVASETTIDESPSTMYVGTITSGTAVTAVAVNKVSRMDQYRPSLTPIGSGIPVTSGTPNGVGNLAW